MPWNPDSGDELASAAINIAGVESSSMKIWGEFLKGWFSGATHTLAGSSRPLPLVNKISFQEQDVQPEDGLYLQITTDRQANSVKRFWSGERWVITEHCRVNFWFRSRIKGARTDGHNSRSLVRLGADTLFAILSGTERTTPLQRKGLGVIRPMPPVLIGGGDIAMRQLPVGAVYSYAADTAPAIATPSGSFTADTTLTTADSTLVTADSL